MKQLKSIYIAFSTIILVGCGSAGVSTINDTITVTPLKGFLTQEEGIEQGISAQYSGLLAGDIVIAGGCNFPEKPVVDGGAKRFYKGVYLTQELEGDSIAFTHMGDLPEAAAYGVSMNYGEKLIIAGGNNAEGSLSTAYILSRGVDDRLLIDTLPSLPYKVDNMAGVLCDDKIYIAGGNVNGSPSNSIIMLELNNIANGWTLLEPFPGGARTQPQLAAVDGHLYLLGGFGAYGAKQKPNLEVSTLKYSIAEDSWSEAATPISADLESVSLGGGCVSSLDDGGVFATGGVNKDIFLWALNLEYELANAVIDGAEAKADSLKSVKREYMLQEPASYNFNGSALVYDAGSDSWSDIGNSSLLSRAGATLVSREGVVYIIAGETKPGVRSPLISRINLN